MSIIIPKIVKMTKATKAPRQDEKNAFQKFILLN
jgi:hypothetical protein